MKGDLLAGLLLLGLSVFIVSEAIQLDYFSEYGLGPGFLPLWLGIGILALASLLIAMRILGHQEQLETEAQDWRRAKRALGTWGGLMVAIALLNIVGFFFSFALLTLLLVLAIERRSLLTSMAVAMGGALGFYFVFAALLGVPLPRGPWGF